MRHTHRTGQSHYQRCPRLYYLSQLYDGKGLAKKKTSIEITTGIFVHRGLELLLKGLSIDDAIADVLAGYKLSVNEDNLQIYNCEFDQVAKEHTSLIEGLIRAWHKKRYPYFVNNYDFVEVEVDREVDLIPGVMQQFRLDGLLRDKVNGLYTILSTKTTSHVDKRKQDDAKVDLQGLSETWGIEKALNIQVHSVWMEYILTGKKEFENADDGMNQFIQFSPVHRGWYSAQENKFAWKYAWVDGFGGNHRLNGKYKRISASDVDGGLSGWIEAISNNEMEPDLGYDPLDDVFVSTEWFRSKEDVEDWYEQISWQERDVNHKLDRIKHDSYDRKSLNRNFPQYRHSCNYPVKCEMFDICWSSAKLDPFVNGYQYRVSHHGKT